MNSQDIRTRIAESEAEFEKDLPDRGAEDDGFDHEEMPWESLFSSFPGLDGNDFALSGWLAEGARGLKAYLRGAGLNDEFWLHIRGAERELLLAARALIDARLELVEARSRKAEETSRLQEIDVEF